MAEQALKDKDFDLLSAVYHASQGVETAGRYLADAQQAGDQEAAQYFEEVRRQYAQLAQRGKQLLKRRLQ